MVCERHCGETNEQVYFLSMYKVEQLGASSRSSDSAATPSTTPDPQVPFYHKSRCWFASRSEECTRDGRQHTGTQLWNWCTNRSRNSRKKSPPTLRIPSHSDDNGTSWRHALCLRPPSFVSAISLCSISANFETRSSTHCCVYDSSSAHEQHLVPA